jgi:TonB family protein
VWLSGSLIGVLLLIVRLMRLRRLASRAELVDGLSWLAHAERIRRLYGLSVPVALLRSDRDSLLVTWGWRRPKVLLPADADDWTDHRICIVLAHELAHIVRGDWVVQLGAETLRILYWFNPLIWILCRRLRIESERSCDDAVLARGIEGSEYAAELLALARSLKSERPSMAAAPAMARPSSLEGRIRAMLNATLDRRPVSRLARFTTVAALSALTLPVAAFQAQTPFYPVTGIVWDATNRAVPDARVVLTQADSGAKYEVQSDATGRFTFAGVPPAAYSLEVARPGFAVAKETLRIGSNTEHDVRLRLGQLQETITVSGSNIQAPPPDAATLQRRADARRRFTDIQEREKSRCAAGGAASDIGGRILQPAKLRDMRPVYPDALRAANIGGTVVMDVVIGADGNVRDIRNTKGPHPDLVAAAATAVRQWQFSTTLLNCEPSDVEMLVTVNFDPQK